MATAPNQQTLFSPTDCSQWRTESLNLAPFIGTAFELVFENIGAGGNQLFLDNIKIVESSLLACGVNTINVTNDINTTSSILAKQTITASNTILPTADVTYQAGTAITLTAGFHAQVGSNFLATIEDCALTSFQATNAVERAKALTTLTFPIEKEKLSLTVYPNPFAQQATIVYHLPQAASMTIKVVDFLGRAVKTLQQVTMQETGTYHLTFQAENLKSGTYFIVLENSKMVLTERLLLVR